MMRRNGGYTFIEILIAMTILIIGIVAIMRMLPIALHEAHLAGEHTMAAAHADAMLGRIRASGAETLFVNEFLDNLNNQPDAGDLYGETTTVGRFTQDSISATTQAFNMYTGFRTSFQRFEGAGQVDLQRVVFSVEMPDGRRESFVTYVARQ